MRGLVDVGAILPESRRADAGKRERQRNLANKSVHILEEVSRIQSAMAIIKNKMRRRRAGDNSEQSALPCCRSKPEDRHLCVAGNALYRPADFSSPNASLRAYRHHCPYVKPPRPDEPISAVEKLSIAERLEFVIQPTTHHVAGH